LGRRVSSFKGQKAFTFLQVMLAVAVVGVLGLGYFLIYSLNFKMSEWIEANTLAYIAAVNVYNYYYPRVPNAGVIDDPNILGRKFVVKYRGKVEIKVSHISQRIARVKLMVKWKVGRKNAQKTLTYAVATI